MFLEIGPVFSTCLRASGELFESTAPPRDRSQGEKSRFRRLKQIYDLLFDLGKVCGVQISYRDLWPRGTTGEVVLTPQKTWGFYPTPHLPHPRITPK